MDPVLRYRERWDTARSIKLGSSYLTNLATGEVVCKSDVSGNAMGPGMNLCWDVNNGRPPYQVGGPMFIVQGQLPVNPLGIGTIRSRRLDYSVGGCMSTFPGDGQDWRKVYTGSVLPALPFPMWWPTDQIPVNPDDHSKSINPDDLSSLGNEAWNKLRPKVEQASLGQALAEITETPEILKTTAKGFKDLFLNFCRVKKISKKVRNAPELPKWVANQWLNFAFGWSPFINDMVDLYKIYQLFDVYVAEAKRHNNKWQRRRFTEPVSETRSRLWSNNSDISGTEPLFQFDYILPGSCLRTVDRVKTTSIWFEGSFMSVRPEFEMNDGKGGDSATKKAAQFLTLSGLNINPVLLYNITPWTWLANWFTNTGDTLQRLQDELSGGVVAKYFYLMRTIADGYEYSTRFSTYDGQTRELKWFARAVGKRRAGSDSPFGFALKRGPLSTFQSSILAALGLSKGTGRSRGR